MTCTGRCWRPCRPWPRTRRLAARRLRPGGALVSLSTAVTRLQQPTYAAYAAAKGEVEAMALILARELRGRDVTVNTVAPGPTATPLLRDGKSPEPIQVPAPVRHLDVHRRDRLSGTLHEYQHAA